MEENMEIPRSLPYPNENLYVDTDDIVNKINEIIRFLEEEKSKE